MAGSGLRWSARHTAIAITAGIGAAAAILSYEHALIVTRWVSTPGWSAYLVPLLPDGLIGLSSAALYEAAQTGTRRPWQAGVGLGVGIVVTVVLNVASGWHHGWGGRLLNALAPVALLIAVGVLEVMFRRGRGGVTAPAVPAACGHLVPATATRQEQAAAVFTHIRECEGGEPSYREVGRRLGIHHRIAGDLVKAGMNGGGTHE